MSLPNRPSGLFGFELHPDIRHPPPASQVVLSVTILLLVIAGKLAAKTEATAPVVSNHGGRQLDGTASSIPVLPRVADAVGGEIEVMYDGGIRTGQDVLRALALGARSCLIGRAYIFGLAAGGEAGVAKAIDVIRKELDVSMALTGVKRIKDIGLHILMQH
jgi:L-lactate dehydrogenase (cytochrome)